MKIEIIPCENAMKTPMPSSPFIARHLSTIGPLCIVSMTSGINPLSFSVMFLQGTGGPAVGDVWGSLTEEKIRRQFIPLNDSVVLKNIW